MKSIAFALLLFSLSSVILVGSSKSTNDLEWYIDSEVEVTSVNVFRRPLGISSPWGRTYATYNYKWEHQVLMAKLFNGKLYMVHKLPEGANAEKMSNSTLPSIYSVLEQDIRCYAKTLRQLVDWMGNESYSLHRNNSQRAVNKIKDSCMMGKLHYEAHSRNSLPAPSSAWHIDAEAQVTAIDVFGRRLDFIWIISSSMRKIPGMGNHKFEHQGVIAKLFNGKFYMVHQFPNGPNADEMWSPTLPSNYTILENDIRCESKTLRQLIDSMGNETYSLYSNNCQHAVKKMKSSCTSSQWPWPFSMITPSP